MDLAGDGQDEILIAYRSRVTMIIFKIAQDQLLQLAAVDTLTTDNSVRLQYSRKLDVDKTGRIAAKAFYFKTPLMGPKTNGLPPHASSKLSSRKIPGTWRRGL